MIWAGITPVQLESRLTDRLASQLFFVIKIYSTALISRDCQHIKQIALNLAHCWKSAGRAEEYEASGRALFAL